MKFLDEAKISVVAGNGGNGCVSFRRERHIPNGGPDGGNGGRGGSVYLEGNNNLNTLIEFQYQSHYKAQSGIGGAGRNKTGVSGDDCIIQVPLGTEVFAQETNESMGEITFHGQRLLVAAGGEGGAGNHCFKSGKNRSPTTYIPGTPGEVLELRLSLKLLADVGLLGLPNAGKSTFIRAVSEAKPKVADYPFTTLKPHLGVVRLGVDQHFVVADIPGLIRGASHGAGLGLRFLKHLERTRLLLHIVDIQPSDNSDPIDNIELIHQELAQYGAQLGNKPCWIVFNKLDAISPDVADDMCKNLIAKLHKRMPNVDKVFLISSLQRQGSLQLCQQVMQFLNGYV